MSDILDEPSTPFFLINFAPQQSFDEVKDCNNENYVLETNTLDEELIQLFTFPQKTKREDEKDDKLYYFSKESDLLFKQANLTKDSMLYMILHCNTYQYRKQKGKVKTRKEKPDNILKRIKSSFHKNLYIKINDQLEKIGKNFKIEKFPQDIITTTSLTYNSLLMNSSLEDLFNKHKNTKNYKLIHKLKGKGESNEHIKFVFKKCFTKKLNVIFNEYIHSEVFYDYLTNILQREEENKDRNGWEVERIYCYIHELYKVAMKFVDEKSEDL